MLLSIDPGLRKMGFALFDTQSERLVACGLARGPRQHKGARQWLAMATSLHEGINRLGYPLSSISSVVYEMMQIYDAASNERIRKATGAKLNPPRSAANLLELVGVLGAALAPFESCNLTGVKPRQWKPAGQSKAQCHALMMQRLTAAELEVVDGHNHDTRDAVAIGLWKLRR